MTESRSDLDHEIALEQAHVDKVYANLSTATASAKSMAQQGREIFMSDRTNFLREEDSTALFERDAFAYQAARRLAILDAEHEGLVFGRIDLTTDEPLFTVLLAAVVLGETITAVQLAGGVLILAAVVLLARAPRRLEAP